MRLVGDGRRRHDAARTGGFGDDESAVRAAFDDRHPHVVPTRHVAPIGEDAASRLRTALETARRVLWEQAAPAGISAREISSIDDEIENVLAVLARAEAAGHSVNVTYVS